MNFVKVLDLIGAIFSGIAMIFILKSILKALKEDKAHE